MYCPVKDYKIPNIDVLSLLFDSPIVKSNDSTVLHVEAACPSNFLTKGQARSYTKRIAYHLRKSYGIGAKGPGKDVVVTISSGQVLLPTIFYGVIAAGGVYSAASSAFTHLELARQVKQGRSKLIVASPDCKDVAIKAAQECNVPLDRVLIVDSDNHKRSLQDVQGKGPNFVEGNGRPSEMLDWERISDPRALEESVICLLYSSGTTGVPKGVLISHCNVVAEGLIPYFYLQEYIARNKTADPNYSFQYRTLAHLPAAHVSRSSSTSGNENQ